MSFPVLFYLLKRILMTASSILAEMVLRVIAVLKLCFLDVALIVFNSEQMDFLEN